MLDIKNICTGSLPAKFKADYTAEREQIFWEEFMRTIRDNSYDPKTAGYDWMR